ncbi:MAG: PspC domain-containing protein [Chloroflexi bacterium]|nr:PspC domain-containing protein [Chloroflexota bacterium]
MAQQVRHGGDGWLHRLQAFLPVRRSRDRRMLSGVCGGLGEQIGVDPNLLRLLWIALTLGTFGGAALLYVAFALLLPEADLPTAPPQEIQVVESSARRVN